MARGRPRSTAIPLPPLPADAPAEARVLRYGPAAVQSVVSHIAWAGDAERLDRIIRTVLTEYTEFLKAQRPISRGPNEPRC